MAVEKQISLLSTSEEYREYMDQLNADRNGRVIQYKKIMGLYADIIPLEYLIQDNFFDLPASTKYHGVYKGGLFDHSYAVTKALLKLTAYLDLQWQDPRSPYIVGMFHDYCKTDMYKYDEKEDKWVYNTDQLISGHGDKSVILLSKYLKLTDEEIHCIRWHMGAYETDTNLWNYYGRSIEKYPNVLYTHTADMIASRIDKI